MSVDPFVEFLRDRGSPPHVVSHGLGGLVRAWERSVADLAGGGSVEIDDYLNDLDVRTIIAAALKALPESVPTELLARLDHADRRFRGSTIDSEGCVWGEANAKEAGWTPVVEWWLYRKPKHTGADDPRD